jgi:organic hydroperoxide reductase OsmC/OhrA
MWQTQIDSCTDRQDRKQRKQIQTPEQNIASIVASCITSGQSAKAKSQQISHQTTSDSGYVKITVESTARSSGQAYQAFEWNG